MSETNLIIALAAGLIAFGIATIAALRGWSGWLELKRAQLDRADHEGAPAAPSTGARIELADLKERVRRLEAIANGTDA